MEIFIVCLFQDNRCLLIVDRQEYQISAGLFCFIKLYGEIGIVIRCKCLAGYYLQTLIRGLCYEGLADTIGVLAGAVVDDSDLGCQFVLADVLSGCTSLIRIKNSIRGNALSPEILSTADPDGVSWNRLSDAVSATTAIHGWK